MLKLCYVVESGAFSLSFHYPSYFPIFPSAMFENAIISSMDDTEKNTDQNAYFEEKRKALIDNLKSQLSSAKTLTSEQKQIITAVINVLDEFAHDINSAHARIALRKQELIALNNNMHSLANAIRDIINGIESFELNISTQIARQNESLAQKLDRQSRNNRRFYIGMSIAGMVIIGFMAYLTFGSKEAVTALGSLTQALKLVDIII